MFTESKRTWRRVRNQNTVSLTMRKVGPDPAINFNFKKPITGRRITYLKPVT